MRHDGRPGVGPAAAPADYLAVLGMSEEEFTSLMVKVTPELKARLKAAADRRCIGQGMLARRALELLLDRLEATDGLEVPSV